VSTGLSEDIASARGAGAALPTGLRTSMEAALGADFSGVRVHAGSELAGRVASTAFTLGRDIHFAPGAYQPGRPSGQWLLAHELTHVVQQGASTGGAGVRGGTGARLQRHASKEHYLLGTMTPAQIKALADGKANIGDLHASVLAKASKKRTRTAAQAEKRAKKAVGRLHHLDPDVVEAVRLIDEQLAALNNWRTATADNPDPATVVKGDTTFDHHWGGQLVTIRCKDDQEIACTVGDLNALPDFFGSMDDIRAVSRSVVFKTLQVIRRETYVYLNQLKAELTGGSYTYNRKTERFSGLRGNKVNLPSANAPDLANAAFDVMQTETMLEGGEGETGLHVSIGASATLGRNACHFPPESWLRWREHHLRARALIDGATNIGDLGRRANEAIALNAFGEHYLQDSFAGGHMINKGFVMAEAMKYLERETKRRWNVTPELIDEFRRATAHSQAYKLPKASHARARQAALGANPGNTDLSVLNDPTATTARDPQSALEAARSPHGAHTAGLSWSFLGEVGTTGMKGAQRRLEVDRMGLDTDLVSYEFYRQWLNDLWIQKVTNTLHDKFCVEGLVVASPAKPKVFTVYGDSNMMRSSEGAEETALTSQLSRDAINTLVENKGHALLGMPPVKAATSLDQIFSHFPDRVRHEGITVSLEEWATGAPMKTLIRHLLSVTSSEYSGVTGLISVASSVKSVSAGLAAEHEPGAAF
jgi:hypothetical protein